MVCLLFFKLILLTIITYFIINHLLLLKLILRDLWKRLLAIMSQVSLNLLHYYITSQKYARNETGTELVVNEPNGIDLISEPYVRSSSVDGEPTSLLDESSLNALDTTNVSEGMLEDLDRSEQLKELLSVSYPHLVKAFKRNYDKISLDALEIEVQELIISLQAATGMLKIFMLSKEHHCQPDSVGNSMSSPKTLVTTSTESGIISQDFNSLSPKANTLDSISLKRDDSPTLVECTSASSLEYASLQSTKPIGVLGIEELKSRLEEELIIKDNLLKELNQYQGLVEDKKDLVKELKKYKESECQLIQDLKVGALNIFISNFFFVKNAFKIL